jgi:hypothetical protein
LQQSPATTYFTNHAIDLGSLAASTYAAGTLSLQVQLEVTTDNGNSGFFGGLLLGG